MISEIEFDVRAVGDALPAETFDIGMDLDGHTITWVIQGLADDDVSIAGSWTVTRAAGTDSADDPGASAVTFTPSSEVIAGAAGAFRCSIVIDKDDPAAKQTIGAGWLPIRSYPG